ncbi:uncharacterized protein N7487_000960 [Penicillium crustosum]|uniref:uncharacterized protein n=1 Tax=Penicillium crustosum TaxID=36656 RepID=UPI00239EBD56|nr:uncharacterized protein N7487_000960 [Penicillium crustosum]KAJ5417410.1 hypothetical protein N7487_000960 [Penicillium crustosum]
MCHLQDIVKEEKESTKVRIIFVANHEDSLVVTHPTTNSPACGLSTAERTGSPVFHTLWSYVSCYAWKRIMDSVKDRKCWVMKG